MILLYGGLRTGKVVDMLTETEKPGTIAASERERKLLEMIRALGFGEINIYVADGQPVRAEEIKKSVKF